MRIGIFTQCYHPTHNGVVSSIDSFLKVFRSRGHEVFIIAPHNRLLLEKEDSNIIRLPSLGVHKDYPPALTFLAGRQIQIIKNLKLDIIHCQHPFIIGNLGIKLGHKLNIPVVYTYHTLIANYVHYFPGPDNFKEKIAIYLSRNFCNRADHVVTPSNSMKKILLSYGVSKPIDVIPTGTDISDFENPYSKAEIYSMWKIQKNRHILLYLARIAKEKNIEFLLSSVSNLKKRRDDFQLLLVGGGPQLAYFQKRVFELGLADCTTFTDMQKKPGVNRYFGAADIFVFPSITETQGIVITEAMAAGIPSVAINKMGPSDIITNNKDGYLTDLNENQFTDKINYLLDNKEVRLKMGKQAKINANKYSTDTCTDLMENLYEKAIQHYNNS